MPEQQRRGQTRRERGRADGKRDRHRHERSEAARHPEGAEDGLESASDEQCAPAPAGACGGGLGGCVDELVL